MPTPTPDAAAESATVFCTNCGHENRASSNFCSQCGAPLGSASEQSGPTSARVEPRSGDTTRTMPVVPEEPADSLSAEDEAAVNALPQGSSLLVVRRGSNAGSRFLLDTDEVTAGRSPDADIFLDDISVSRRHCVFRRTDETMVLKDVGSLNGTYVNREVIDQAVLSHGDEVQIGKYRLVYFASPKGLRV